MCYAWCAHSCACIRCERLCTSSHFNLNGAELRGSLPHICTAPRCVRRSYGSDRIRALAFTYPVCVSPAQVLALACSHACRCRRGYHGRDSLIRFPPRAELMLCSHPSTCQRMVASSTPRLRQYVLYFGVPRQLPADTPASVLPCSTHSTQGILHVGGLCVEVSLHGTSFIYWAADTAAFAVALDAMRRNSNGSQDVHAGNGVDVAVVPAPARAWPGRFATVLASMTCSTTSCTAVLGLVE